MLQRLPKERVEYQTNDIEEIARKNGLQATLSLGAVSAQWLLDKTDKSYLIHEPPTHSGIPRKRVL